MRRPRLNTLEFFVHHEDIRRAAPTWSPRALDVDARSALWSSISLSGRFAGAALRGVPVVVRRTDTDRRGRCSRGGADPVVVSGPPAEIVLFLFGRAQTQDLTFEGPGDAVRRLREASLGA